MIDSDDAYDPHDDFWLEIERDLDREIAEPPRGLDLDNDTHVVFHLIVRIGRQ
jgi:hypothetical protein